MIEHKLIRVAEDDPTRCQAIFAGGQCPYKATEHSTKCAMHGGNKATERVEAENLRNYRLGKWQGRVDEFSDSSKIKSLREEIGILRMMLEETVNKCENQGQLILFASKISDLVMKIERLVATCHKLESSLGMMIDKIAAQQLANEIVAIIGEYVTDPETVAQIADRIGLTVTHLGRQHDPSAGIP